MFPGSFSPLAVIDHWNRPDPLRRPAHISAPLNASQKPARPNECPAWRRDLRRLHTGGSRKGKCCSISVLSDIRIGHGAIFAHRRWLDWGCPPASRTGGWFHKSTEFSGLLFITMQGDQ
jgi:hypothetical protein